MEAMAIKEIKVLYVEDEAETAVMVDHALDKSGLVFQSKRVDTREAYLDELQQRPPDVILSDHGLPSLSGLTALAIARDKCPGVPFIFVTGALGEELAIQTFEHGASDYVLKDRLDDLGPAVRRALRTAEEQRQHRLFEDDRERLLQELNEALAKVKTLSGLLRICSGCKQIRDEDKKWVSLEAYFEKHLDVQFSHGLCPNCAPRYFPEACRVMHEYGHHEARVA